ncbi:MAG: GFA family protein [Hyphomicrobiales bacterium]|nr:GFA family protein [Hyphomicrobiales bacterium]
MTDDWKLPWDGGCLCGQVRFRISAPPLLTAACHCAWCQKRSASAYSLTLSVPTAGFAVTQGEPELGQGPSPNSHFFCPRCRNWLFLRLDALGIVNVRPTMLDEHGWFRPFIEIFASRKLPLAATSAVHSFETMPDPQAFGTLIEGFVREGARPA